MISAQAIRQFYPASIAHDARFQKYMLKEYVQLLILDHLSRSPFVRKLAFIGGTNLRLVKGIDRFSEDLNFDCKDLPHEEFLAMSDSVLSFLTRSGFKVVIRDRESSKLTAFRRSLHFPELLFDLDLSGHKDERFMIKLEAQDQGVPYPTTMALIKGCGLLFPFPVPPDPTLCAMKLSALLNRAKGRDFYDVLFLLAQTKPDYHFLAARCNVHTPDELKTAIERVMQSIDLGMKQKDFEHLLFNRESSTRIQHFREFIQSLLHD